MTNYEKIINEPIEKFAKRFIECDCEYGDYYSLCSEFPFDDYNKCLQETIEWLKEEVRNDG